MRGPGSSGEQQAQARFGTSDRATAFYEHQVLASQSTDAGIHRPHGDDAYRDRRRGRKWMFLPRRHRALCRCWMTRRWPIRNTEGMGCWPAWGTFSRIPHIGLIFLDYYQTTIGLHVNGTARVIDAGTSRRYPT